MPAARASISARQTCRATCDRAVARKAVEPQERPIARPGDDISAEVLGPDPRHERRSDDHHRPEGHDHRELRDEGGCRGESLRLPLLLATSRRALLDCTARPNFDVSKKRSCRFGLIKFEL